MGFEQEAPSSRKGASIPGNPLHGQQAAPCAFLEHHVFDHIGFHIAAKHVSCPPHKRSDPFGNNSAAVNGSGATTPARPQEEMP
jgi:hypothetical protein